MPLRPPTPMPDPDRRFALVVGGTGMLRGVCLDLASLGLDVGVMARDPERLEPLLDDTAAEQRIFPICVDYTEPTRLEMALKAASMRGCVPLAVLWVRSDKPAALRTITAWLARHGPFDAPCRVVHVTGSMSNASGTDNSANPEAAHDWLRTFAADHPRDLAVRRVSLGWMPEGDGSRWLTHEEICAGVIQTIRSGEDTIVGQSDPEALAPPG